MRPVLVFQHIGPAGPGYFGEHLARRGIPYEVVRVDQGESIPADAANAPGLVFLGGTMSANDDYPWIEQELALIRRAVAGGVPVLGHCLGGQLIARALGGRVIRNPVRETGWHPVQRLDNPVARDWLDDLPAEFPVFQFHDEAFTLPPAAVPILEGRSCLNQAFVLDGTLALQSHVEATPDLIRCWTELYADYLEDQAPTVQKAPAILSAMDDQLPAMQRAARTLYDRWCEGLRRA